MTLPKPMAQMLFIVPVADTVLLHFKTAAKAKVDAAVDHRVDHVSTSCFVHHTQVELADFQVRNASHKIKHMSLKVWA